MLQVQNHKGREIQQKLICQNHQLKIIFLSYKKENQQSITELECSRCRVQKQNQKGWYIIDIKQIQENKLNVILYGYPPYDDQSFKEKYFNEMIQENNSHQNLVEEINNKVKKLKNDFNQKIDEIEQNLIDSINNDINLNKSAFEDIYSLEKRKELFDLAQDGTISSKLIDFFSKQIEDSDHIKNNIIQYINNQQQKKSQITPQKVNLILQKFQDKLDNLNEECTDILITPDNYQSQENNENDNQLCENSTQTASQNETQIQIEDQDQIAEKNIFLQVQDLNQDKNLDGNKQQYIEGIMNNEKNLIYNREENLLEQIQQDSEFLQKIKQQKTEQEFTQNFKQNSNNVNEQDQVHSDDTKYSFGIGKLQEQNDVLNKKNGLNNSNRIQIKEKEIEQEQEEKEVNNSHKQKGSSQKNLEIEISNSNVTAFSQKSKLSEQIKINKNNLNQKIIQQSYEEEKPHKITIQQFQSCKLMSQSNQYKNDNYIQEGKLDYCNEKELFISTYYQTGVQDEDEEDIEELHNDFQDKKINNFETKEINRNEQSTTQQFQQKAINQDMRKSNQQDSNNVNQETDNDDQQFLIQQFNLKQNQYNHQDIQQIGIQKIGEDDEEQEDSIIKDYQNPIIKIEFLKNSLTIEEQILDFIQSANQSLQNIIKNCPYQWKTIEEIVVRYSFYF